LSRSSTFYFLCGYSLLLAFERPLSERIPEDADKDDHAHVWADDHDRVPGKDGQSLDAYSGPFRIVVPGDARPARWIRQLTQIAVVRPNP
jgi:hypothetical protein